MQMLALKEIHMTYGKGDGVVHALRGVDMEVERGELLAVTGKSGCGKSTLLNILGGVCKPTGGSYFFEGKEVSQFSARQLADFRTQKIGFVVQHFALIQDMTVFQNIALPLRYRGYSRKKIEERVYELLDQFERGEFEPLPPQGLMEELYSILAAVELPEDHPCIFRSNHVSNYVQLAGTLPKDKERLLGEIAWSASELGKIKDWDVYNNTRY